MSRPDWQQRVFDEHTELEAKARKLKEFLDLRSVDPTASPHLSMQDHDLLFAQFYSMMAYLRILEVRIARFT